QLPTHGATVVVSELHVYTGLNTFINIPSTSVAWNRVDAAPASAVKTGNPLANPVGQCVGLAFNLGTGVVPNPNTGNAGTVTIKGHKFMGSGCTPMGGANPTGCVATDTITCTRMGTGGATTPFTYVCDTPTVAGGTDNRPVPVTDFFDATTPAALTIATTGGTDYGAVSRMVTPFTAADMDVATRTNIATAQIWNGT